MLTTTAEASRAKHKFAVKRNSWPKTRGVAMNPVDHVRYSIFPLSWNSPLIFILSLTVVVTTSILVKLRPSLVTQHKVKKQVSLQLGEPVCSVVRKKRRIRYQVEFSHGNTICLCYGAGFKDCVAYRQICLIFPQFYRKCSDVSSSLTKRTSRESLSSQDQHYAAMYGFCRRQ